jgi:hypothetical protein
LQSAKRYGLSASPECRWAKSMEFFCAVNIAAAGTGLAKAGTAS